ncbi:prepilin-type N-terminal cleavage/methylation domain-containing protein [Nostoc sp. FACHB-152]|uniref:hormogonium polysaccharide secretion pseudopilin HpsC n=1 Tax=unclassified Nostoc TaxID=2593658 RepID=UPI001689AFE9|nr:MULTISPECIES: hormogonium polysaccharide secretion pseudopilin HpsC [unclassified Nostoc]MBD2448459.1 prepilin-type N-terminal cleavage/methylation domain-containing protein [Nostoc sp. FACHB-152]MBD2466196.1 prepilin-type N-terminal cleavage/methylation domain-containing protein [Nostoc sp. FACHB-145]
MNALKFILISQLKHSQKHQAINGFTLIELLVAMIIAVMVITPLMLFMVNVLNSDRQEQAKATTEQELQSALDYMARDLQQAVYIYDADGVTRNRNTTDLTLSGIQDQIPPVKTAPNCTDATVCKPILVFWKREFIPNSVGVTSTTQTQESSTDDNYAYSLVGYYLITNTNGSNSTWSKQARIGRFQIRGAVNALYANSKGNTADTGFNPPPLDSNITATTLKERMNQWQTSLAAGTNYTQQVTTLVDYISTTGPSVSGSCSSPRLVGDLTTGFYACVDANEVLAQVFLRGNALARIQSNNLNYQSIQSSYFPNSSIRVQGRGFLFNK